MMGVRMKDIQFPVSYAQRYIDRLYIQQSSRNVLLLYLVNFDIFFYVKCCMNVFRKSARVDKLNGTSSTDILWNICKSRMCTSLIINRISLCHGTYNFLVVEIVFWHQRLYPWGLSFFFFLQHSLPPTLLRHWVVIYPERLWHCCEAVLGVVL